MSKTNKVLISGGAGFIGSHTADILVDKGYEVVILDNLSWPVHDEKAGWPEYINKKAKRVFGDVRNKNDWEKALKDVSYVIHLAAYQDLLPNFSKYFEVNSVGTANLFEVILEKKLDIAKVVVASSQFVYGEGQYFCQTHDKIIIPKREEERLKSGKWKVVCHLCGRPVKRMDLREEIANPCNQYSISKYCQEMIATKLAANYGIPAVAMRYSIVQGQRQSVKNHYSGVMRLFTTKLMSGIKPTIFEDGMQLRDYVNVKDVAAANLLAMESAPAGEVYNVGGGKGISVVEFEEMVESELGTDIGYEMRGEYRVGDTRHSISDITKIMKLGWTPKYSIEDSIREYHLWLKDQKYEIEDILRADRHLRENNTVRNSIKIGADKAKRINNLDSDRHD